MAKRYIIGIDIGGTFTDLILYDMYTGEIKSLKTLTNPINPEESFIKAIRELNVEINDISLITHGTTLGTNMLLGQERLEIPDAILITNKGFTDIIEIGRQNRPELYNIYFIKPKPLIPRNRRIGIKGRIDSKGDILEDIDVNEIRMIASQSLNNVETVIVSLLNSYANPTHEEKVREVISSTIKDIYITLGSEVDPRPGEYERTVSAVINGILKPIISRYLDSIQERLRRNGYKHGFIVMASHGGVVGVNEVIRRPSQIIESGPAAGAIAASYLARLLNEDNVIALDMGGTTSKASAILDGKPLITTEYEVGGKVHMGRVVKGSGYPLRMPHIDVAEIGVGGGSIIWVDEGGQLRVGPISAGADPGPACYNRGGERPTLTDAYLILGWLPDTLGGGEIRLSIDKAYKAFEDLCSILGLEPHEVAYKSIEIANEHLHRAISIVSIERGYDIKDFTIALFGGAAPIHTTFLIELGFKKGFIPPYAGVYSAYGLIQTNYRYILQRGVNSYTSKDVEERLSKVYNEMEEELSNILAREGIETDDIHVRKYLEMRYWRQGRNLLIEYDGSISKAIERFTEEYRDRYGYTMDEPPYIEAAILEAEVESKLKMILKKEEYKPYTPEELGVKHAYIDGAWIDIPIYTRNSLNPGAQVTGPAIIYGDDSTTLIRPGYRISVNGYRVMEVEKI